MITTHIRWSGVAALAVLLGLVAGTSFGQAAAPAKAPEKSEPKAAEKPELKTGLWTWKGPKTGEEHWVHVPEKYDPAVPCPIIVMTHGIKSSGAGMIKESTCRLAVERGWIAVAPTWNWERDDSPQVTEELLDLIKQLVATYNVDTRTIVASGYSGGGGVSLRSFTKYPDIYGYLVSQSSNFYGQYLLPPHVRLPDAGKRPVAVLWGEKDHPLIIDQGPKERDHFTRAGYPTTSYIVPGGGHTTEPQQAWAWLDAILQTRRGEELAAALKGLAAARSSGGEARVAQLLAPFQALKIDPAVKGADGDDAFVKEWRDKYAAVAKTLTDKLAEARKAYAAAVDEGRKQLAAAAAKFAPQTQAEDVRWVRKFKERWAAVPDLCREADAAYEKAFGAKLPDVKR